MPRYGYRSDLGESDLDAERHRVALGGVGQRDLYGAGGWRAERGVTSIDVRGEAPRRPPPGPRGYRRSDERIYEEVCESLGRDREVDSSNIEVHVSGGEVTLSGSTRTRWMKLRAEAISDTVPGVVEIHNQVRVG